MTSTPPITGSEVFKRTATYERDANTIRLHAPQWKFLLAFDGQKPLSEVASSSGPALPEAVTQAQEFLKKDWIAEQPITLEEYLRRASAGGKYSGGVIPSSVVIDTKAEAKPESGASAAVSSPATPPPLAAVPATATTPPPLNISPINLASSTRSLPSVSPVSSLREKAATPRGPMRLSAVVDYIVSMAESIPLGQLLAYRVFLRVPPEVLQSEDIVSIHLVDDTSMVKSESLQKAIAAAVQDIVKRTLPDSVYAPA